MKYTYRSMMDKKIHYTTRIFSGWQRGGILNAWGAIFASKGGGHWIPEYLLTKETLAAITPKPYDPAAREEAES